MEEEFSSLDNQVEWQMRKLEAIGKAATVFSSSPDLEQTLHSVADEARRILEFKHCAILVCDRNKVVQLVSSTYFSRRLNDNLSPDSLQFLCDDKEVSQVMETTRPVYVDKNDRLGALLCHFTDSRNPPTDALLVPQAIDSTRLGLMVLINRLRRGAPSRHELDAASLLGFFATAAIRNAVAAHTINHQLLEIVQRGKREWEQTFDAISDGIYITNTERTIIRANKAFAATFDADLRQVIGKKCFDVVWGNNNPCPHCPCGCDRTKMKTPPSTHYAECVVKGMTAQIVSYPMLDDNGELMAVVHIMKDLTEQKQLQELFVRSENLRVIGEMASGIAHDFNNLLSSIIGWSEIMLLDDLPARLRQSAVAIHRAAVDGTETVRRIQEYTRIRKDTVFASVDLNEVVRGALELARPRWKDGAEKAGITISISGQFTDIPPAKGSASDLREVFLNIVLNSIDAMPKGGVISIVTGQRADRVFAAISDTGIGMPEEVRSRVFDPFFTTKGSTGSGLGLSVAYGIVARHGGDLTVQSIPDAGSTFTVYLPVAPESEMEQSAPTLKPSKTARVLLVDDDERVLEAIKAMLESEGHTVTSCLGGRKAIEAFGNERYDLVITDVGMPKVNGWEVAARVKASSPGTPVVFLTGWGAEIAFEHLSEMGIDAMIQKPCRLAALRETMINVLHREGSEATSAIVEAEPAGSDGHLRILVIEDHKWFGEALRERLEIDGHDVFLATSGGDGLRAVEDRNFDLVLSDLKLPDISGLEVAGRIKKMTNQTFTVIMTGDIGALSGSLSSHSELDGLLPKPWKDIELQEVIKKSVERRRRR